MPLITVELGGGLEPGHLAALTAAVARVRNDVVWRLVPAPAAVGGWAKDAGARWILAFERALPGSRTTQSHLPTGWSGALQPASDALDSEPDVRLAFLGDAVAPLAPLVAQVARKGHVMVRWPGADSAATVGLLNVLHRSDTTPFAVSVWGPRGGLLHHIDASVPTQLAFSWTHDLALRKAVAMAAGCALRLLADAQWPTPRQAASVVGAGTLGGSAVVPTWLAYCAAMPVRVARKVAQVAKGHGRTWGIALSRGGWQAHLDGGRQAVPNPPGRYWADPFLLHRDGRDYLFVEDFDLRRGVAHLSALEIDDLGQVHDLGACLQADCHLSFPFLFEWQGQLYMCPETSGSRQIRVYRCDDFPLSWTLAAVLMDEVSAADTMLLERGGRWWMLTNIDPSGGLDHCSELHVFWADSPLSSTWTPHPGNPVIADASCARNGGMIAQQDGTVYRVSQIQHYAVYGGGWRLNLLRELTPMTYDETEVARYEPRSRQGADLGAHHLSSNGRWTVSDRLL